MDELDGYIAQVLGVEAADLAEPAHSASPVRAPASHPSFRGGRVGPFTALAASVVFAVVLIVALRMGGEGRPHRGDTASAPSRAATFIDEAQDPNLAIQPPLSPPANGGVQTAAAGSSLPAPAQTATTKPRKVRIDRTSRSLQVARADTKTLRNRTRLHAPTSDVSGADDASPPRAIQVIDTAAEDRLDAIDAIRLLRQR